MDRATAKIRLTNMVAAASRPVLTDAALEALLTQYALPDSQGRLPADVGFLADRFDLNGAAAEGWRYKAALVAGDFTFSADGASYDKGAVLANCLEMEAKYAALQTGTSRVQMNTRLGYDTSLLIP